MQVLTLDSHAFEKHAEFLARSAEEKISERLDAIVAVRRGGSFVCDAFCRYFPKNRYRTRYDVTLQRPSTKRKGPGVSKLLKLLPRPILDIMRMAESYLLSLLHRNTPSVTSSLRIPDGLNTILKDIDSPTILIIDDAIDSGDTLYAIVETLKKMNPNTSIRIAVMTQTTPRPRIHADLTIYKNRTLIRFPWSNDYRKK